MKLKRSLLLLALTLLLAACGVVKRSAAPYPLEPVPTQVAMGIAPPYYDEYGGALSEWTSGMPAASEARLAPPEEVSYTNALEERMVIMNVSLTIVVPNPETRMNEIGQLAKSLGGFVVSTNLYQVAAPDGSQVPQASISIRVPAQKLDTALEQIKANAVEVRSENQNGQDVTATYVDLQSRLKALEAARNQLEEIMKKAEKTEDVLNVFSQLQYYNEQIEIVKGQLKYYEESVAYSLISITLIAQETIQPIKIGPWTPGKAARDAIQDLVKFFQNFVDALIYFFLLIVPAALLILGPPAFILWLIVRAIRKRKGRQQSTSS